MHVSKARTLGLGCCCCFRKFMSVMGPVLFSVGCVCWFCAVCAVIAATWVDVDSPYGVYVGTSGSSLLVDRSELLDERINKRIIARLFLTRDVAAS
jgi:hypothetical protein